LEPGDHFIKEAEDYQPLLRVEEIIEEGGQWRVHYCDTQDESKGVLEFPSGDETVMRMLMMGKQEGQDGV
jgi:hypothetical protein